MNEAQLKLFIRQAFSVENIADKALDKTDPIFKQVMQLVREKILALPEPNIMREEQWRAVQEEITTILQSGNDVFAQFLVDELYLSHPKMKEDAQRMIAALPSTKVFPGAAGQIEGMPMVAGLQSVQLQESVRSTINKVKVNNTRLVDLFGLQDIDTAKPAVLRDAISPWVKSNLKVIDGIVRTGILQGADTEAIANQIGKLMRKGVVRSGIRITETVDFQGTDAARRIRAQAKAVARTAVQDMNRRVHEQVWDANQFSSDLRWEWVAAFDSRTCPVCAPLDNILRMRRKSFPEWPIHVNCRCQVVLVDPEDEDPRAGIDVSPEEDGFDKKGGRKYKSKINVKGENLYRKAFDVKGENPSYADFLAQADRKTQGMFFGGENAGSIRAERFRSLIKQGMKPRDAMNKLITNAPTRRNVLKKIDITKIKFKPADEVIQKLGSTDFDLAIEEGGKILEKWDKEIGLTKSLKVYESIQKKQNRIFDQLLERYEAVPKGPKKAAAKAAFLRSTSYTDKAFQKYRDKFRVLRTKMLETNLTEEQVKSLKDNVWFSDHKIIKNRENYKKGTEEFIRMFNGKGFTKAVQGSATDPRNSPTIGTIQAVTERASNNLKGTVKVPFDFNKTTLFHELMHSVEAQNPWMGTAARKWAATKAYATKQLEMAFGEKFTNNLFDFSYKGRQLEKPLFALEGITGKPFADYEKAWADDYLSPYMGKFYDMKTMGFPDLVATEVFTVAIERLAEGNPTQIMALNKKHPELFRFFIWLSQQP